MLSVLPQVDYNKAAIKAPCTFASKQLSAVSFTGMIKNMEPQKVWDIFEEITPIYRESGHNEEISNYLLQRLKKANFKVEQTQDGEGKYNILATRNVDNAKQNAIMLQAHMDMVAVSDNKDPKKPIKLNIDGDFLKANNRTLGADNGIGLAIALAIAEDRKFKDLPLQIIFTVDEETGMYGAHALKPEDFKGKYLLNIDSEAYGDITIGCAGMDTYVEKRIVPAKPLGDNSHRKLSFVVSGGTGGHSGEDIDKGRLNVIKAGLNAIKDIPDAKLISVVGGEKFNSIPRDVKIEILVPENRVKATKSMIAESMEAVKTKQKAADPNLQYSLTLESQNASPETKVMTPDYQEKFLRILTNDLDCGPISFYDNGDKKSSQNIGIINLQNAELNASISLRSADQQEKNQLRAKTSALLSELFDRTVGPNDSSPIWQPKLQSDLAKLAAQSYKELGVKKPKVYTCHGGLENSMIAEKRPDLDQISVGPDIFDPHSTQERVSISSVDKFYKYIQVLIEKINNQLIPGK